MSAIPPKPCYNIIMKNSAIKKTISLSACLLLICAMAGCDSIAADGAASDIYISEVVSSNSFSLVDEVLGSPDWIELHNPSKSPIELEGYALTDNLKDPHKWTFPAVTLSAGGYLTVYAAKYEGESNLLCTGFGLSKSGELLYLVDPYYNVIQQLEVPELVSDVSYARTSDGSYGYCSSPTPNAENSTDIFLSSSDSLSVMSSDNALAITEVMPQNRSTLQSADGSYHSWAEIKNISSQSVLLSDYYLSDSVAEPSKWRLPAASLDAGQYAIVYLSGEDSTDSGEMHASFRLGSTDSALALSNGAGSVISMINWTNPVYPGICVVGPDVYTSFPTPAEENSAATFDSLSLSPMDATAPLRISELLKLNRYSIRDFYGDRSPWVELFNSSASPVSLGGYCLSDDDENPFKWHFPEVSIEPGEYKVIFLSGNETTDGELHTPFSLSRTENQLMLTDTVTMTYDMIELDPAIGENVSYGLGSDGQYYYYASPTPGAANTTHPFPGAAEASITYTSSVYISEVAAVKAAKSDGTDWIELHNSSDDSVNLEGWHLTDDPNDIHKFTFPSFRISSGEYASVSASTSSTSGVSAPFNISASGDTLILTDEDGNIKDIFETGALRHGVTSGRTKASDRRVFFSSPTRGKENTSQSYVGFASSPIFSDNTLYHKDTFQLTLSCLTPGAKIYYTTDGSKPTADSSLYTGPLTISKNTVVKAVASADGLLQSDAAAATFLFEEPHTLPVVSLSIDSTAFDEVYSVTDRWEKVEREGYCEYYEADGLLGTSFPCGLRVNGASTLTMRQKSLSIFLRGGYGQSSTSYQFFPGNDVAEYTSVAIRNSGQDASKARLRDSFFSKCVAGLNLDYIHTRPVVVYINGQYWGLYDLNENQNEDYLATRYGVDPDTVNIIRRNETPLAGSRTDFYRVRKYGLEGDTASDAKYQEFCQWVDAEYVTDYIIAQSYFANGDMFNQKYWRTEDYTIKWRPIYYDLDLALSASSPTRNILPNYFNPEGIPSQDGSLTNMDLYVGLRKNAGWCEAFGERYVYVALNYFNPERVTGILDEMVSTMEPEMARHIKRWGTPSSLSQWKSSVKELRDCLEKRQSYALTYLQKEFGFSDAQMEEWKTKAAAGIQ